jgi:dihydroorotate dehydrogenase (NAD+) catalytic subunit
VTALAESAVVIPGRKQDLVLRLPWLNAAGILGFGDECTSLIDPRRLGAFVTNPVSLGPRTPSRGERSARFPGGLLLHTGHPNAGFSQVVLRCHAAWRRMACPVIIHILARSPSEVIEICSQLEGLDPVAAIEVGLLEEEPELGLALIEAAGQAELPVLAHLPLNAEAAWAKEVVGAGADAVVLGPPRGGLPREPGRTLTGRMFGPCLFPLALQTVTRLAPAVGVPLLAGGGITNRQQRQAILQAGAAAAVLDIALWLDPDAVLTEEG